MSVCHSRVLAEQYACVGSSIRLNSTNIDVAGKEEAKV